MEALIEEIMGILRTQDHLEPAELAAIIRRHNQRISCVADHLSKKKAMRFYLAERAAESARWRAWNVDRTLDERLVKTLQVKPRRTASGVATITVITKPMPCAGACLFCPNDVRMPKSYLSDEPACQRAERNFFDPYLQVTARMRALREMGHETDKIELIVLGGSWSDYPIAYQRWFIAELFRALNDGEAAEARESTRRSQYEACGISCDADELHKQAAELQAAVDGQRLSYNEAHERLYGPASAWEAAAGWQTASMEEVEAEHARNENARHRVVGLVVETRPDTVDAESLAQLRRLGCTKVQMGIQTLDPLLMRENGRAQDLATVRRAFALLRLFGFKIHVHFMANLKGATPAADAADYRTLVTDPAYLPDEVKLYPCVLVQSARLRACFEAGAWAPYDEDELVRLLAEDVAVTPPFMRISRMIRDISAHDIKAGNRKTNLRQLVEGKLGSADLGNREIRLREISVSDIDVSALSMERIDYETAATREAFLQWVTPEGRIAGFLRLSLPRVAALEAEGLLPVGSNEAMIREVHVYGRVARVGDVGPGAQHLGLGRALVERACAIAQEQGYAHVNVISSVGTRAYYRKLGFQDHGLYQRRTLQP